MGYLELIDTIRQHYVIPEYWDAVKEQVEELFSKYAPASPARWVITPVPGVLFAWGFTTPDGEDAGYFAHCSPEGIEQIFVFSPQYEEYATDSVRALEFAKTLPTKEVPWSWGDIAQLFIEARMRAVYQTLLNSPEVLPGGAQIQ